MILNASPSLLRMSRLKEHRNTCKSGITEKSAVAEHVWESHQLGGDISAGQGQRTRETTAEGGPAHPDGTCRGALQQGQRTGDLGLLDCIDEETEREGWFSVTFE